MSLYRHAHLPAVSDEDTKELAAEAGIHIPQAHLPQYTEMLNEKIKATLPLFDVEEVKPPVLYARTPGYRPPAEENKYNAWLVKTDIKGASSGILNGKRVVIKDNVAVAGVPMMNGSRMLEGYIPDIDATVVTRILNQGGTIVGKSVCENLTCSGDSYSAVTGPVLNPHDVTRSAGGSTSGSAVLVVTGEADMAIGSDTGGSIRTPSSWCGIVGMKPTFGLVPYTGAMNVYPAFDHLGPMAQNVTDCAALLQAIAGPDEFDYKQNCHVKVDNYLKELENGIEGTKIGILCEAFQDCDTNVCRIVRTAVKKFENSGCKLQEVSIPEHKLAALVYSPVAEVGVYKTVLQQGGVSIGTGGWHGSQLADRFQTAMRTNEDLPVPLKLVGLYGAYMQTRDKYGMFAKAENLIPKIRRAFDEALKTVDILVMPTTLTVASKLPLANASVQELVAAANGGGTNCFVFNLTGHPAVTMPAGELGSLPVGLMIVGRHFEDATVLRVARTFERLS